MSTRGNDVSKLLDLMRRLGSDAALAEEYGRDKEAVLRREDLSEDEREAMRNSDYAAVKSLTGLKDGQFATNHIINAYDSDSNPEE